MTLPVLPSLLPLETRSPETAGAPTDVAQAFRHVLSSALGSQVAEQAGASGIGHRALGERSDFRLQTSGQVKGEGPQVPAGASRPGILATIATPDVPNANGAPLPTPKGPYGERLPVMQPSVSAGVVSAPPSALEHSASAEVLPGVDASSEPQFVASMGLIVPDVPPGMMPAAAPIVEPVMTFVPAIPGATTTPAAIPSSGVTHPVIAELHPEFRDRLDRVIDRMESEFGYKVEVVETVRSQSRQDALYAQGRERPGQVVTWTRNSRHTDGLAADLLIDGSYTSVLGYERLAQVAREEGLRTLGPRDKGHVELPRNVLAHTLSDGEAQAAASRGATDHVRPEWAALGKPLVASSHGERARQVLALNPNDRAPSRSPAPIVGPDTVPSPETALGDLTTAPVAAVARVATVASMATVAVPGVVTPAPRRSERAEPLSARRPAADVLAAQRDAVRLAQPAAPGVAAPSPTVSADPAQSVADAAPSPGVDTRLADADTRDSHDSSGSGERFDNHQVTGLEKPSADAPTATVKAASPVERTSSMLSTDRVAQLLDLRESAAERPLSSVLLRLDSPDGSEDRIRIGLRGSSLGADFDMADRNIAEDLGRNLAELARSVERQGLEPEHLQVRSSWTREGASLFSQAAAGEREGLRTATATSPGSGNSSGRDGRAPRQDTPHDESPRHKSRRDPKGDR